MTEGDLKEHADLIKACLEVRKWMNGFDRKGFRKVLRRLEREREGS